MMKGMLGKLDDTKWTRNLGWRWSCGGGGRWEGGGYGGEGTGEA